MEPLLDLSFALPARGSRTLVSALHGQLRAAILDGRLLPGVRLPATRALAERIGVSRNTALTVYELLLSEGYLTTRHGSGTYVATTLLRSARRPAATTVLARKLNARWRDATPLPPPSRPVRFDFRPGYPDQREFPFDVWRRLTGRAARAAARSTGASGNAQGDPDLRRAIAHYVSSARAVACDAEDVVVTAGAQQAFDLLARVLVTPGRTVVALENPGYTAQRAAFVAAGAIQRGIPVDDEGLIVDRLPKAVDVIGVTPSHQFPLGVTMSAERRAALLTYAREHQAVVVEDDYDAEFRLAGRPLDALQTLDREQRVFYVGTFSKSMLPSLRVGYVIAPPWARAALVAVKQVCNWHVPAMTQAALAAFISEGHLARHVRRMRLTYAERHEVLMQALQRHLGTRLVALPSLAGLHAAALLNDRTRAQSWVVAAGEAGIRLETLARYAQPPLRPNGLIFGYGLVKATAIETGIRALAQVMRRR